MTADEHVRLIERIRGAEPHLLFVALGQPKGEIWLHENCEALGVPACVQLGASFDFVAGRVPRAPRWLQRLCLEWAYRIWREPRRMLPRYAANAWFLARAWWRRREG
jgi:N-acetylglucosaminyldiphosphoundecaprenol N-acetyl-beta-D-mannosaminyltransferase